MDEKIESNRIIASLSPTNYIYPKVMDKHSNYVVKKWTTFHRMFYRFMTPIMRNIIPFFFKFEAFGIENMLDFPEGTPIIFAGNHRSHLDALAGFSTIFPSRGNRRYLTTITQGAVLKEIFLFRLMGYLGGHAISQKNKDLSIDYLYESLKAGLAIGIFPQGGRIARTPIEDYQKLSEEGKSGVGRLVLRMNGKVPVIPFYIHGTAEALSRGSVIPKFVSYNSLTLGKPIYFKDYEDTNWDLKSKEFHETSRTVTNKIMREIQVLCLETEKGVFQVIENKIGKNLDNIDLSEIQSRKLRRWLRKYSHHAPYDFPRT